MIEQGVIAQLYEKLFLIRQVELKIAEIYHTDVIKSPVHLSIGQESVSVASCVPLLKDDIVSPTYRCHAAYLAKGGDLNQMMAELYGKKTGCAGGKAGSMHLVDMPNGVLGASAVVGTTIPVAAGYAFALQQYTKQTGHQRIVVSMFGDGATEEGCFYETLNFAVLKKLPIIFVCENNGLAIHEPLHKRWGNPDLCERVKGFGIETHRIVDGDTIALYDKMQELISRMRSGQGPFFLECDTYRWLEHVGPSDDHFELYRDKEICNRWKAQDALITLANLLPKDERGCIEAKVMSDILMAIQFAEESALPVRSDLLNCVYSN